MVMNKGYHREAFVPGPLANAMEAGAVLFINELNRMPEGVQNVLLPAMDEGILHVPQFGTIKAHRGFQVIATQNPREFVATSQLSEALLDRLEWVPLGYQSFDEEKIIVTSKSAFKREPFVTQAVEIVRLTRNHPAIRRGASVRATTAILSILEAGESSGLPCNDERFFDAVRLALPNRIELQPASGSDATFAKHFDQILLELLEQVKKKIAV
jgi:MoxR-like ATPase